MLRFERDVRHFACSQLLDLCVIKKAKMCAKCVQAVEKKSNTIKVINVFVRPFRVSVDLCNLNVNIINANVSLMHP